MNITCWIRVTVFCIFLITFPLSLLGVESERPNFVVILCDDLGWGDLSCFGHPHIQTENLDRLAAEGLRLTACYSAAPVCSPSRAGLLTGRNPNWAGIYDWIPAASEPGRAAPHSRHLVHLRREEITLPKLLKDAGYATAMAGKWHCNSMFNSLDQPQPNDAGFDHWLATQNNASPTHENPVNFVRNGESVGPMHGFSCQLVADEAIRWLESNYQSSQSTPFFLYVPFHEPHEPIESPKHLVDRYREVSATEDEAQYFANVHNMDLAVGRLLQALDRLELSDNTLIFFSSDNGPETLDRYPAANRSYGRPGPLRGMKLWTTEAGVRVPGIIRWPGKITPSQVSDTPISSLDLLPTFCSLVQIALPPINLDGMDISLILNGYEKPRAKPLFWFYYSALNEQRAAMRDGRWKLLAKFNAGQLSPSANVSEENIDLFRAAELTDFSLYDLSSDIGETIDVSSRHPEELRRLVGRMKNIYRALVETMHVWPSQ